MLKEITDTMGFLRKTGDIDSSSVHEAVVPDPDRGPHYRADKAQSDIRAFSCISMEKGSERRADSVYGIENGAPPHQISVSMELSNR